MSKVESRRPIERRYAQLPKAVRKVVVASRSKKASDVLVLDLQPTGAFTDFFVIGTAQNVRQLTAVADAIEHAMSELGRRPAHVEGYGKAGWILLDFFDFVVHLFTPEMREFYALERLWGSANRIVPPPEPAS